MATQNHRGQVVVELVMCTFFILLFAFGAFELSQTMNKVQASARFQNSTPFLKKRFK